MLIPSIIKKGMSRKSYLAAQRTQAIARHMMSTSAAGTEEPTVLSESLLSARLFKLNRPKKRNALNHSILDTLRPTIENWNASDLCGVIWGCGEGKAFCAGGDVAAVVQDAANPETLPRAIDFFKKEFELDYLLATLKKPYIAVMDGITMGGGVGLSAPSPFRIATENTEFAMPETKIGYCPDVGASFYLSRLDGELGTYLALTGNTLKGRAVFEHGLATHFIPSRRVPMLLESVSALEQPGYKRINQLIEENSSESEHTGELTSNLVGPTRAALDYAFRHDEVEAILADLKALIQHNNPAISEWAARTLAELNHRSPTSLKIALKAIRLGRTRDLVGALEMEYQIASAFCKGASSDFATGVNAVLITKTSERPDWSPASVEEVTDKIVDRFFNPKSPYFQEVPKLNLSETASLSDFKKYALPSEIDIGDMVMARHRSGGNTRITLDELVSNFENAYDGKMGVKEKVLEVASRRCETVDNADGNRVWLQWVHTPHTFQ